jgi:hypothetical protein
MSKADMPASTGNANHANLGFGNCSMPKILLLKMNGAWKNPASCQVFSHRDICLELRRVVGAGVFESPGRGAVWSPKAAPPKSPSLTLLISGFINLCS